ncbi:MAG: hypothetical protein Q8S84_07440 [bacterium]|nr:hypothetical protein [bacterium]
MALSSHCFHTFSIKLIFSLSLLSKLQEYKIKTKTNSNNFFININSLIINN